MTRVASKDVTVAGSEGGGHKAKTRVRRPAGGGGLSRTSKRINSKNSPSVVHLKSFEHVSEPSPLNILHLDGG